MGLLFTLAIAVAIAAVAWKRYSKGRSFKGGASYEEDDAERLVATHADIDAHHMRCTCGGRRIREGEGPKGAAWRVLVRCGSCGRRRALLFRVAS